MTSGSANETALDVAIVGGGLAGNLLARQLRRQLPDLSVGLFERSTETSFKVGEATVEIAANYLTRKLGLTYYLYEEQLPKNGIRYFFDRADRDARLEELSEIGSVNLPFHPAFQLDRARFEADLLAMNGRDGVMVRRGARVHDIALGEDGAPHRFSVEEANGARDFTARWLVDAAGRGRLLAGSLGLRVDEVDHRVGSVWGRFENVVDIDDIGSPEFRERVRHTSRRLSTLHFWYDGYWIWFIPLRGGLTSVGVTGRRPAEDRALRTEDGFRAFLAEHHAIRELLVDAKLIDVGSYARIAYGTKRFFHPDGWGLTGESATSADPLYSPGSDFIALENDLLCDLIARSHRGEGRAALARRSQSYDAFLRFRHEATMLLYTGLYPAHGSFELGCIKWTFDIGLYYNLWVSSYLRDEHLDLRTLRRQLRLRPFVLDAMRNFAALFRKAEDALRARGEYYRENTGHFFHGLADIDFTADVGSDRSEAEVEAQTLQLFNRIRAKTLALIAPTAPAVEPLPLTAFVGDRDLSER